MSHPLPFLLSEVYPVWPQNGHRNPVCIKGGDSAYHHFEYTPCGSYLLQPHDSTAVGCRPMEIILWFINDSPVSPCASNFILQGMQPCMYNSGFYSLKLFWIICSLFTILPWSSKLTNSSFHLASFSLPENKNHDTVLQKWFCFHQWDNIITQLCLTSISTI